MTKKTKKYTLTAQDIQAYLCELGIKPTKEVSIYSIEYYFDKQTVSTDKLSVEKLQEQLNTARYFFKNILDVNPNLKKGSYVHLSNCVNVMKNSAEKHSQRLEGMMIEIRLFNPYIDITYRTDDFPIERWYQFLDNFRKGNEEIISFRPTYEEIRGSDANSKIPDIVTICPRNWGKVSVVELEGSGDEQSN